MAGELFIDSGLDVVDSLSDSQCLSEKTENKGKQGVKRKMSQNDDKKKTGRSKKSTDPNAELSSLELKENYSETGLSNEKRRKRKLKKLAKKSFKRMPISHHRSGVNKQKDEAGLDTTDVFQEARKKKLLYVSCGKITGTLYRIKYDNGEKCILCKGQWFTPRQFEKFGGKANCKKWKVSIYYKSANNPRPVQLLKLIQNGCLSEFGHLKESLQQVTQTDRDRANTVQNETMSCELYNSLKDFPESWKSLFSKTLEISVCRNEEEVLQKERIQPDISSDESESVAERVKMNRRESVIPTETVNKIITQQVESTAEDTDSPAHPTDAPEPAVSPVIEEADQTTDEEEAAPLGFSTPPAEWQNPVDAEDPQETGQMQLFEFLAKQFTSINDTLKSIDSSLKKLVEKQSHDSLPQYNGVTLALQENPQINCLVKQE